MEATYETNAMGVSPGDIQQMMLQAPADMTLKGFMPDHGLELQWFAAGAVRAKPGPDGAVPFGQRVSKGAYITAMVKNVTDKPIIGKGVWFVEGASLPDAKKVAQPMGGVIPPAKAPALKGATKPASAQRITSYPVGRNELAVAMTYGECKRLMEVLSGGVGVQGHERPAYLRRFNHALAIFQGQEEIEPQEDAELETLRAAVASLQAKVTMLESSESEEVVNLKTELEILTQKFEVMSAKQAEQISKIIDQDDELFQAGYEKAMVDISGFALEKLKTAFKDMQTETREDYAQRMVPEVSPGIDGLHGRTTSPISPDSGLPTSD